MEMCLRMNGFVDTISYLSSSIEELPWYAAKQNMRDYLAELNKEKKVDPHNSVNVEGF